MKRILSVCLALLLLLSCMPYTALAEEPEVVELTLAVKEGTDIYEEFVTTAKQAKDDTSGTIYKITIPAGEYTASKQLKLWSNTYLYMNGVTIKRTSAFNMLRFGNKSDLDANPATGYSAFSNIHIEGGTFDGGGYKGAITQIGHSQNISFKGVTFRNVENSHMIEAGGCSDLKIENCTFKDFTGNWSTSTNYEAVQFEVVTSMGNHFGGYPNLDDETPTKNVTVTGCTFKNLQRGIGTHTGIVNSYFDNINISNNTFENITGYAIIATNYRYAKINGNEIDNCGAGIIFRSVELAHSNFYASRKNSASHPNYTSASSEIKNNTMRITTGYSAKYNNNNFGLNLIGEKLDKKSGTVPAGDFRLSGVTASGNKITMEVTGYGIWMQGCIKNTVSSNTVTDNLKKKGKTANGDYIRLEGSASNTVSKNTFSNITAKGGYDSSVIGIALLSGSDSNTVSSNTIKGMTIDGIKVEGSASNKLKSNKITGAKRDGIHLDSAKKTSITSNTIKKTTRYGVSSESSASVSISKNTISKSQTALNLKNSKSAKLVSNKLSSSSSDGIKLTKSNAATIHKNTITSQKRDGIFNDGSSKLIITSNTIKSSKRYGINSKKKQIKKDKKNKITKSGKKARSWK